MKAGTVRKIFGFGALGLVLCALGHADSVLFSLDGNFVPPDYTFYGYTDPSGQLHASIPATSYTTTISGTGFNNLLAYAIRDDFSSSAAAGSADSGTIQSVPDFSAPDVTTGLEVADLVNQLNVAAGGAAAGARPSWTDGTYAPLVR